MSFQSKTFSQSMSYAFESDGKFEFLLIHRFNEECQSEDLVRAASAWAKFFLVSAYNVEEDFAE